MPKISSNQFIVLLLLNTCVTIFITTTLILSQPLWAVTVPEAEEMASPPSTLKYQGRLTNSLGLPVNEEIPITFKIYDAPTGGIELWTESHPAVSVNQGLFAVLLGTFIPLPTTLFANNNALYLGLTVGTDAEMTPRELLTSVPWAIHSSSSEFDAKINTIVGSGVVTTSSNIFSEIPDMNIALNLSSPSIIFVSFNAGITNISAINDSVIFRMLIDDVPRTMMAPYIYEADKSVPITMQWGELLPAGSHIISIEWRAQSGTASIQDNDVAGWEQRVLTTIISKP